MEAEFYKACAVFFLFFKWLFWATMTGEPDVPQATHSKATVPHRSLGLRGSLPLALIVLHPSPRPSPPQPPRVAT